MGKNSATKKSNTKKKSRPLPTNLRTLKPEPNSLKRPSSSLKRTSTNLKIASTPKSAKSELSQKTWTILFKELEIYKSFTAHSSINLTKEYFASVFEEYFFVTKITPSACCFFIRFLDFYWFAQSNNFVLRKDASKEISVNKITRLHVGGEHYIVVFYCCCSVVERAISTLLFFAYMMLHLKKI